MTARSRRAPGIRKGMQSVSRPGYDRIVPWLGVAWVLALVVAVAAVAISRALGASPETATLALGTPMFAKVQGTGTAVNFAWWSVRGATGGYQVLRAPDPGAAPTILANVPAGTLGYTDAHSALGTQYYQLVALGANASRSVSAWFFVNTPTITSVTPGPVGTSIAWTSAQPSPGGYEIWRTADPTQRPSRVGTTPAGMLTFNDKQSPGGTQYYQVTALGAGGTRAASPWFSAAGTNTPAANAASATQPTAGTGQQASSSTLGPGVAAPGLAAPAPMATSALPVQASLATGSTGPSYGSTAPAVSSGALNSSIATAPPPVSSTVIKSVPPVVVVNAVSFTAVWHGLIWLCADGGEAVCGSTAGPTPGSAPRAYTYHVAKQAPGETVFTDVTSSTPVHPAGGCSFGNCPVEFDFTMFVVPQTTFRVTRKDPLGQLLPAVTDFVFASPEGPQEPGGFTAAESPLGQVNMTWNPVPGATGYRISEKGLSAPPARVTGTSTTFKNVAAGTHTYQIETDYSIATPTPTLPEATVLVHFAPPAHAPPYLSKGGVGSAATATQHATAFGLQANADLADVGRLVNLISQWDNNGAPIFRAPTVRARYANVTELGLGRSVLCWQWPNSLGIAAAGMVTLCLAGNHGTPAGFQAVPNASALLSAAAGHPGSVAAILTSPLTGQLMVNFAPNPHPVYFTHDPNDTSDTAWATGWMLAPTTLDSEGPKYAPQACMACHGGSFNAVTGKVTGASLLPIDPALVAFGSQPGADRAANEEPVRALNAIVAASGPSAAVSDFINGLYAGQVASQGAKSQANYIPAGWSQQAELYKTVVKPNCAMCHLAASAPLSFATAAGFMANKASVYADVCVAHTMPNAEAAYNNFWFARETAGSVTVNLPGYLFTILGYSGCP